LTLNLQVVSLALHATEGELHIRFHNSWVSCTGEFLALPADLFAKRAYNPCKMGQENANSQCPIGCVHKSCSSPYLHWCYGFLNELQHLKVDGFGLAYTYLFIVKNLGLNSHSFDRMLKIQSSYWLKIRLDTAIVSTTITAPISPWTIVKSCPKTHLRPPGMSKVVNLFVISPDTHSERRIDPHQTIEQLKVSSLTSNGILEINKAHEICSMIREN